MIGTGGSFRGAGAGGTGGTGGAGGAVGPAGGINSIDSERFRLPTESGTGAAKFDIDGDGQVAHARIAVATEPYPGRWTHHFLLTEEDQIDGELLGWFREAWDFAESKR